MCPLVESAVYDDYTAEALQGHFKALNLSTVTPEARERQKEREVCMSLSISIKS